MEGQTSGNSPLVTTVHQPFKVAAEKGRKVRLKGKKGRKEGRKGEMAKGN